MAIDRDALQQSYNAVHARAVQLGLNADLCAKAEYWQGGGWRVYFEFVVGHVPLAPEGRDVLDLGCGYGLLCPALFCLGARSYIGVDLLPGFDDARRLFVDWPAQLVKPEDGYLPVQPESVDIVIANEVVSHVPKAQLPIIYDELCRVLRPGGAAFISDGNGLDSPGYIHRTLLPLYDALENGPDGVKVGALPFPVTVGRCFLSQRKDLIHSWYPDLEPATVEHIARNTSGLHTAFLRKTVDRFVTTGELVRRPYQKGSVPVVPTTGVVEERGFFAEQVVLELRSRGLAARADMSGSRMPAPWFDSVVPSSYPDGNFCVTATKPA